MNHGTNWWTIACVVFLGACSTYGGSQPDPAVQSDLEQMKRRILDLQEKAAMAEVEMERLREQVARLEARPLVEEPIVEIAVARAGSGCDARADDSSGRNHSVDNRRHSWWFGDSAQQSGCRFRHHGL